MATSQLNFESAQMAVQVECADGSRPSNPADEMTENSALEREFHEIKQQKVVRKSASLSSLQWCPSVDVVPTTDAVGYSSTNYSSQNDSCERDASASSSEVSRLPMSSSTESGQTSAGDLKSVGSMGHPDHCTECNFYFFAPQGCAKGSGCRFCHEFHPRKNLRKHRRFLKRLTNSGRASIEGGHSADGGDASTNAMLDSSTRDCSSEDEAIMFSDSKSSERGSSLMSAQPALGTSAVVSLQYLKPSAGPAKLTLVVGQEVHLPPRVDMDSATRKALQHVLCFSVDPPLQNGLSFDSQSGIISGLATEPQANAVHMVTVSTVATGPGGIQLGLVPLASSSLLIRIVDLKKYKASYIWDVDDRIFIEFKLNSNSEDSRAHRPGNIGNLMRKPA